LCVGLWVVATLTEGVGIVCWTVGCSHVDRRSRDCVFGLWDVPTLTEGVGIVCLYCGMFPHSFGPLGRGHGVPMLRGLTEWVSFISCLPEDGNRTGF
jgi:hypothetical protein